MKEKNNFLKNSQVVIGAVFVLSFFLTLAPKQLSSSPEFASIPVKEGMLIYNVWLEEQGLVEKSGQHEVYNPYIQSIVKVGTRRSVHKVKLGDRMLQNRPELSVRPIVFKNLKVGDRLSEEDAGKHAWYVNAIEAVEVPAGTFKNCVKIVYYTNPDEVAEWYDESIGLIKSIYYHHGTVINEVAELKTIVRK